MASARAPSVGAWRVIVVEDADRMTERTANVLLKAIEEPPPRTVWLLAAPSPLDVLVTIRSRCRPVRLRIPTVDAVAELLVNAHGLEPDAARIAAMAAQCHIGVARRLATDSTARAQRDRALALPEAASSVGGGVVAIAELVDGAKAEAERAGQQHEESHRTSLHRAHGIREGEKPPQTVRTQIDQALKSTRDDARRRATRHQRDILDRALLDLLSFYRDVLAVQYRSDLDLVNASHAKSVREAAATSSVEATLRRIDAVTQARERLGAAVAPALALEAMAVGLTLAGEE
jgi:DNA polymerase-3 subunit delta'